ncbi:sigma-70 family RNA polymerase sigma factor [Castellaniella hirudinis]|uniref:sigma-70 family RNA polymerase sigma factor n=1 Tax=Castellaniella hirudinis TaxID=1144617 RepID=UPI0039C45595
MIEPSPQQRIQTLYTHHSGWLYAWLRRRLGCPHHAADLLHDVYLRVLASGRTPAEERARPHLMQIAKGLVIDRYRRQRIEQAYLDALAAQPEACAPSPEERALALEALMRICAMLDGLSPRVRETFLLSRFEGWKYADIAAHLGISAATVRKYMLEATMACFQALEGGALDRGARAGGHA